MPSAEPYDAVVVGSGATGFRVAVDLSRAGMRVLVVEAGPSERTSRLQTLASRVARKAGYRVEEDLAAVKRQHVQSLNYAWAMHPTAFVNDEEDPYLTKDGHLFSWIRSRQIGGRMMIRGHGMQFYRMSPMDFAAADLDGLGENWPFSYEELAPYYERVERDLRIVGTREELPTLPDSIYVGTVPLTRTQRRIKAAIESAFSDRRVIPRRTALEARYSFERLRGPRPDVLTDHVVTEVHYDPRLRRATGVTCVRRHTRERVQLAARIVIMAASTIETARVLLASKSAEFPDGIGNRSDVLGRYLMDHPRLGPLVGEDRADPGDPTPAYLYVPQFVHRRGVAESVRRGYGVQIWTAGNQCNLIAVGEMVPRADCRVTLHPTRTNAEGQPLVVFDCAFGPDEIALMAHARAECEAMLKVAGYTQVEASPSLSPPGSALHEAGTARMGKDPRTSYLNPFNQSWEVPNLFVVDAASWPSQGVQNVTLTMIAVAARAASYIAEAFRRGDL